MEDVVQLLLDYVVDHAHSYGAIVVFLSSFVEYVFPPFPGDVVTLLGAWLVVKGAWSFSFALAVVTAGSLLGAAADYGIGFWLAGRLSAQKTRKRGLWGALVPGAEQFRIFQEKFRRWGGWLILANRFMPGIRAFFFVAAGTAKLSLALVLALAALSALVWNCMLLWLGYGLGQNWRRLKQWFSSYTTAAWLVLGAVAVVLFVYYITKRARKKSASARGGANEEPGSESGR